MKMTREFLTPDTLTALPRGYALGVFGVDEIMDEVTRLKTAFKYDRITAVDGSDEEWSNLIDGLLGYFGPIEASSDTLTQLARSASNSERRMISGRCDQVLKALRHMQGIHGQDYDPTRTALLPVSYAQRIELLIGKGALPVAWLRCLDVLKF